MKCPKCNCNIDIESYNKNGRCSECGYPLKDDVEFVNKMLRSGEKKKNRVKYTKMDSVASESMPNEVKEQSKAVEGKTSKVVSKNSEKIKKTPTKKDLAANDAIENPHDTSGEIHKTVVSPRKKIISSSARKKNVSNHVNDELVEPDVRNTSTEEINYAAEKDGEIDNEIGFENIADDPVSDFDFENGTTDSFESMDDNNEIPIAKDDIDDFVSEDDVSAQFSPNDKKETNVDTEDDLSVLKKIKNKNIDDIKSHELKSDESILNFLKIKIRKKLEKEFPGMTKGINFLMNLKKKHVKKSVQVSEKKGEKISDQIGKPQKKKKIQSLEKETNSSWSSNQDGYYNDITYNNVPKADRISFKSIARVVVVFVLMWLLATFLIYYV